MHFLRMFALFLALTFFLPLPAICEQKDDHAMVQLYCLNIGKADCMLLLADEKVYLIDTGCAYTYPALQTALEQLNISRLDGVFLTHCHQDHEGGLEQLFQSNIQIDALYASSIYYDVKEGKHPAVKAAKERNMQVSFLKQGDVVSVSADTSFTVLGPVRVNEENENNNSLVMHFSSPHGSILFTGDMKEDEEVDLLSQNLLSPADVLKCGHHGDSGATSLALLQKVKPKVALICTSTFEESDTPSGATLSRLRAVNCKTYATQDAQDAIWVTLQNGNVSVADCAWPGLPGRVEGLQASISLSQDTLTLKNKSSSVMVLSGCTLYSSKGEDLFPLPDITLQPGGMYVIGSKSTETKVDFRLDKKKVWHKEKRDMAMVFDAWGRCIAQTDNGMPE